MDTEGLLSSDRVSLRSRLRELIHNENVGQPLLEAATDLYVYLNAYASLGDKTIRETLIECFELDELIINWAIAPTGTLFTIESTNGRYHVSMQGKMTLVLYEGYESDSWSADILPISEFSKNLNILKSMCPEKEFNFFHLLAREFSSTAVNFNDRNK